MIGSSRTREEVKTVSSLVKEIVWHVPAWSEGWNGPWWLLFPLFWLIVVGTIASLAFRAKRHSRGTPLDKALEILASRFARGEIDAAEYRKRMDEMKGVS
jgi:putative membrane protein